MRVNFDLFNFQVRYFSRTVADTYIKNSNIPYLGNNVFTTLAIFIGLVLNIYAHAKSFH